MNKKLLSEFYLSKKQRLKHYFRVMKITSVLLVAFVFCLHAENTNSQNAKVTIEKNAVQLERILTEIENQTNYLFIYNQQVDVNRKVSVKAKQETVANVLKTLFTDTDVDYILEGSHIILSKKTNVQSPGITHSQQARTVSGVVTDQSGEAIIGANVIVKGSTVGTITDLDGKFTIEAAPQKALLISYIGYLSKEVVLGTDQIVKIVLIEDAKKLDEVVVVGYGTQKKVNLTGSIASVSTKDIKDRVNTNVLSAVQGTVPGVTIISRPGSTPSINFRGRGNLGTSSPLYVIDGAIADATFFSNLDPNSIESISFLKDAASSAIYGARAAYGVVLVTTKSGSKNKTNVTYSGYVGIKSPTYLPDLVNSAEYAELMNEARYNREPSKGKNQAYTSEQIQKFSDGTDPDKYPNTDWVDLALKQSAITTQHSLNFSGGSDKVRHFTGLSYLYDDKFFKGQNSDRYNLNSNITSDVTNWLSLKTSVKYIRNNSERKGSPSLENFLLVPSIYVARQSNGEWGSYAGGQTATQVFMTGNPLRSLNNNDWSRSKTENTMIDLGFDLKPLKGLILTGQAVYKGSENKNKSYTALQDNIADFETGTEISGTGIYTNIMSQDWQSTTRMLYTGMAKYNWSNKENVVDLLAGVSYEHYKYERLYGSRKNFPIDGLEDLSAGSSAGEDISNAGGMSENKLLSYFGRANYSLLGKYLLEANLRADASSSFYKKNRWGIFPSFSAGWRVSEETFMKDIKWIDNLKVRASWGTLGNINNVGNYDYFQNYVMSNNYGYTFDDSAVGGIIESKPANTSLTWETVTLTDFGFDFDAFGSKLSIVSDYYIKETKDILLGYNVPVEAGINSAPSQNIGRVNNKGFEFAITHKNTLGKFNYSISANASTNSNKIIDLSESDNMVQRGGNKINYILRKGESIGSFYGYKTDGLYTQADIDAGEYYTFGRKPNAGDIKYVPQRSDVAYGSAISGEDRTIIGKDVPDFTYGLNVNLQYNNFELSLFGQGVSGTSAAFDCEQVSAFFLNSNPRKFHLKRWTEDNPNQYAVYPRIYGGHSYDDYNQYFSDYQVFDADYFRIKTVSLGYMVPATTVANWGLTSLKFFVTTENLFTIRADHEMEDFDPEAASGRALGAVGTKSIAFGLNVVF